MCDEYPNFDKPYDDMTHICDRFNKPHGWFHNPLYIYTYNVKVGIVLNSIPHDVLCGGQRGRIFVVLDGACYMAT